MVRVCKCYINYGLGFIAYKDEVIYVRVCKCYINYGLGFIAYKDYVI